MPGPVAFDYFLSHFFSTLDCEVFLLRYLEIQPNSFQAIVSPVKLSPFATFHPVLFCSYPACSLICNSPQLSFASDSHQVPFLSQPVPPVEIDRRYSYVLFTHADPVIFPFFVSAPPRTIESSIFDRCDRPRVEKISMPPLPRPAKKLGSQTPPPASPSFSVEVPCHRTCDPPAKFRKKALSSSLHDYSRAVCGFFYALLSHPSPRSFSVVFLFCDYSRGLFPSIFLFSVSFCDVSNIGYRPEFLPTPFSPFFLFSWTNNGTLVDISGHRSCSSIFRISSRPCLSPAYAVIRPIAHTLTFPHFPFSFVGFVPPRISVKVKTFQVEVGFSCYLRINAFGFR